MIIGIGNDIIDIARVDEVLNQHPERFVKRVFTPAEQQTANAANNPAASYAKRFAAKEAFVKAIGTGIAQGISWQDIEINNLSNGKPIMKVYRNAHKYLLELTPNNMKPQIDVSLADSNNLAQAIVIISATY